MSIDAVPNYIHQIYSVERNSYLRVKKKKRTVPLRCLLIAVGCRVPQRVHLHWKNMIPALSPIQWKFWHCVWWNLREFNFVAMAHPTLKLESDKSSLLKLSACVCECSLFMCLIAMPQKNGFLSLILPIQSLFCTSNKYWMTIANDGGKKLPHWYGIRNTHIWLHDWTINC